jgi:hypothetical protein
MTTQPSDEDILIGAARAERRQHRSGASMFAVLGAAVAFGAVGCLLIIGSRLATRFLSGLFSVFGGISVPVFASVGVIALGIAGFFLLAAFASSPLAAWGSRLPSDCPVCHQRTLRSGTVPGLAGGIPEGGPRGVVTLCEASGCSYAAVRVTRPTGTTSAE